MIQSLSLAARQLWRSSCALLLLPALSMGQPVNISYLEGQAPVAPDAVTAWGPELFGDKVNLFNGSLEFEQLDTSLPGNNALAVALIRRYVPGRADTIRGQFGDWDLETPRVGGSFSSLRGWVTASGGSNRCSGFSLPPTVSSSTGASSNGPTTATSTRDSSGADSAPNVKGQPGALAGRVVGFIASDYWQGTHVTVPGQGSQEVLSRSAAYATAPADGRSYPLVTRGNWQLGCLPSVQNAAGEGFFAVSPDGVRYRFDWMATRWQAGVKKSGADIGRLDFFLMATEVSDRFGNWVRYSYDPSNPLLLQRIDSSDGRAITVINAGGRAVSASDGTRTFSYGYDTWGNLATILQPDGSRWTFNLSAMTTTNLSDMGEGANCDQPGGLPPDDLVGTMFHPSGAIGRFTTRFTLMGRTYVDRYCKYALPGSTFSTGAVYPRWLGTQALVAKAISGPGMADMNWTYTYGSASGWNPCTGCSDRRFVRITDPGGAITVHQFGIRWRVNEGQLLEVNEGWTGSGWLKTTTHRYRPAAGQNFPEQFGANLLRNSDWLAARNRPLDQRVITQQGSTFTWQADSSPSGFDYLARPVRVSLFSSLGHTRSEATEYNDNAALWVLGQKQRVVELTTNLEVERHTFLAASALKSASYFFGRQTNSFAYRADGTLQTLYDAANRPIEFQNFMRGKPQRAVFADGSTATRTVNNLGKVSADTNEVGTTTTYGFDAMGRVNRIDYPTGDSGGYLPTLINVVQVGALEYGLAPGHWRQIISTGNNYRERYFDGLWRVRLERRYDDAAAAGSSSFVETRYDADGRKTFESYPTRTFSAVDQVTPGTTSLYDGLDRVVQQLADSELGLLVTTTDYLSGFQRQVTNPRGHATRFSYQAFDTPSEDRIIAVSSPESVSLSIVPDVFGKPLSITRGGTWSGGSQSTSRVYVYDANQRLCKTIEPETGATVQAYDLAGNVAWRASGLALPSLNCDESAVPGTAKVSFGYDARDRLKTTRYGDSSPGIDRDYTPDGLLANITSGAAKWKYDYNNRRLLRQESYTWWAGAVPGEGWNFTWQLDGHGNVSALTDSWGTLNYAPNALGQATQISGYAASIAYHPNGALADYTLNNGVRHVMTQNTRGLPLHWRHLGVVFDDYRYDANGNVTLIDDIQEGNTNRNMSYDGLDRLKTAYGPWGGTAHYGYDTLDNLRSSTVGDRSLLHNFDSNNRLSSLTGSQNIGISYDLNGNITQRGGQTFVFDIANRMVGTPGKVDSYVYDGHGRRSRSFMADGSWRLFAYTLDGKLRWSYRTDQGHTRHVYLGDKLISETTSAATTFVHTDALGSPVARTNSIGAVLSSTRTRYEPYGGTVIGLPSPVNIGFTGHVNDVDTGLVYMQQRYYDPIAGRFLSVDPVTTDAKTGSSFNRYVYGNNNPYKFKDPDGRFALPLIPVIIEAVAAAVASNAGAAAVGIAGAAAISAAIDTKAEGAKPPDPKSGGEKDPADKSGELTKAGRAQQKHGDRSGSAFDPAKGTPADKNAQGQQTLDTIVNSPDKVQETNGRGGTDVRQSPDGRGARFDDKGKFTGFIEPRRP